MKSTYIKNAKKNAKRFLGELLPERQYVIGGNTLVVNRKDSAFGIFDDALRKEYSPKEYAEAATRIYVDIGDGSVEGMHQRIKGFKPRVSSWIPYFQGQTTAYVYNFLSVHYALNNPFVFVFRYVLYRDNIKIIDQAYTKVLLPNSMCCITDPQNFPGPLEGDCHGRLIVYVYDPLFKPLTNEFRFFGTYRSDGLRRCAVHSWVSAQQDIFRGKRRFGFRNRIPALEAGETYQYCQEILGPITCTAEHEKTLSLVTPNGQKTKAGELSRADDLDVTDGSLIYTEGYFIGRDGKGHVSRIWHDNGDAQTTTSCPAESKPNDFSIETDFYIPAKGYFAKLVFANPIGNNILVGDSIKVSAYRSDDSNAFYSLDVMSNVKAGVACTEFYQLDLREFCKGIQECATCENEIIQVTVSFRPVGSNISIANINDVQVQVYLYSDAGILCDQYHSSVSYSSLFNPLESPRSNKFCPFYIDKVHSSFLIINNKFPGYMSKIPTAQRNHKIKLMLHLNNELETQIKYVTTCSSDRFYALNVRETFNLPEGLAHEGIVHVFCATANFWCYYMTVGRREKDCSLLCDHLTGG